MQVGCRQFVAAAHVFVKTGHHVAAEQLLEKLSADG